ncbi:hypothetical protein M404DRAFT_792218 [Pisolithus tinctorius Marx 270]|uniref:Uncharacterized protein n=1 Tax=Pisolithus tinctorius Marx 270 TaxID=870435 RepID=A0A0C3PRD3_PISTI|nr:hypothetical protein M404DRAFT_792218 [Pisolithus tinctorius Marx 270]
MLTCNAFTRTLGNNDEKGTDGSTPVFFTGHRHLPLIQAFGDGTLEDCPHVGHTVPDCTHVIWSLSYVRSHHQ